MFGGRRSKDSSNAGRFEGAAPVSNPSMGVSATTVAEDPTRVGSHVAALGVCKERLKRYIDGAISAGEAHIDCLDLGVQLEQGDWRDVLRLLQRLIGKWSNHIRPIAVELHQLDSYPPRPITDMDALSEARDQAEAVLRGNVEPDRIKVVSDEVDRAMNAMMEIARWVAEECGRQAKQHIEEFGVVLARVQEAIEQQHREVSQPTSIRATQDMSRQTRQLDRVASGDYAVARRREDPT